MQNITILGIAAVPAIMGIVEAAKTAGLPKNFAPLFAILLGIGAGILSHSSGDLTWDQAIAGGIALGLAAAGLYSSGKQVGGSIKLRYRRKAARKPPSHVSRSYVSPSGVSEPPPGPIA